LIGVEIDENLHRALTDAQYTAKIFKSIFDKLDLEVYNTVHIKDKYKRNIKNSSKPNLNLSKANW